MRLYSNSPVVSQIHVSLCVSTGDRSRLDRAGAGLASPARCARSLSRSPLGSRAGAGRRVTGLTLVTQRHVRRDAVARPVGHVVVARRDSRAGRGRCCVSVFFRDHRLFTYRSSSSLLTLHTPQRFEIVTCQPSTGGSSLHAGSRYRQNVASAAPAAVISNL